MLSKVCDCNDDHTSELAKVARKETAFPLGRATEIRWNRNIVSLVSSVCHRTNASANLGDHGGQTAKILKIDSL